MKSEIKKIKNQVRELEDFLEIEINFEEEK